MLPSPSKHSLDIKSVMIIVVLSRSGEFFLVQSDSTTAPSMSQGKAYPAEFRVDKDGSVRWFGAAIEEAMGEEKVWFERV